MNGSGATAIANGATLSISGNNDKAFTQRTLNNAGTASWSGGNFSSGLGATFNNQGGGVFDLQGDMTWAYNQGGNPAVLNNTGTVRKSAGTGSTTLQAVMNNDGTVSVQSGTINVAGTAFSNSVGSVLQGSGTIDVSHTTFVTDGSYNPGNQLGTLTIIGNLPQASSGNINIQLGGLNAGVNYDQLIVMGNATLNGALNISLANGFHPNGGDTFEIIKFTSHTGSFDNISGLDLGGGFYLEPVFGSTNVVLTTIDKRPRPQFSLPQRFPNGDIHITLTGIAGQTFVIQATTNFLSWESVLTNVNSGAVFDLVVTDSSSSNYPYRFYRTFQP